MGAVKKIDISSLDSIPSGMDLFSTPFTQVATDKTVDREYLTLNPVNEAPYNFKVLTGSSFLDPVKTRIVTTWRMKKKRRNTDTNIYDWENITADDPISVVNGFGATWIRNLKVTAGGQPIFNSNNLYSYKAALDNELNYSAEEKKSSMNAFGYFYDDSGLVGDALVDSHAWQQRRNLFVSTIAGEERIAEFSAPLYADIFQQPRFLISNMELELEIHPQDTKFLVHAPTWTGDVKLEMTSIRLYVTFVDLQPGVALDFERRLDREPVKIPIRRTELKTIYLEYQRTETHNTAFPDYVPRFLTVCMVPKVNYHGSFATDSMYFTSLMKLREIHLNAGGTDIPYVHFEFDFERGRFIRGFDHLHKTIGLSGNNIDCGITRKMFSDGYTIFPFNLTTSGDDDDGFDFIREGPTMLHMHFRYPIADQGAMVLLYGEWDSIMFIDKTRTVRTDLSI